MLCPPLRICYFFLLLTDYCRLSNKISCVQNNLPFAIKRFGYAIRFLCVLCLNSNLFSQCFLYYNCIFHFVQTLLCAPVLRHGWDGFTLCTQNCVQRYYFFLTYANIFCIIKKNEANCRTNATKMQKITTRGMSST